MKYYTLSLVLSEPKIKASLDRAKTEAAKANVRKLYPALPLAFTPNSPTGEVTNWSREIKGTKKEIKRERGYIFYEIILEVPNYLNLKIDPRAPLWIKKDEKGFENEFRKFVRAYIEKQNSHMGLMFISDKFSGKLDVVEAIKKTVTETKENIIDVPVEQIKEQADEYGKFLKENKKIILGGAGALVLLLLVVAVK